MIRVAAFLIVAVLLCLQPAQADGTGFVVPRTPDGRPDMQGSWTNTSLTMLERPAGLTKLVLTADEAQAFETQATEYLRKDAAPTDPDAGKPDAFVQDEFEPESPPNAFWWDPGTTLGIIRGEIRSSWIYEPANGRLPYNGQGSTLFRAMDVLRNETADNPEDLTVADRCMVGLGSTSGPPMLNTFFNNQYEIVQTQDHFVIHVEMNHDARIIAVANPDNVGPDNKVTPLPSGFKPWMGTSTGHWDGDTFVIETTNFHPQQGWRYRFLMSWEARVTERFTLIDADTILYEFTVDDPTIYTRPWKGELPMRRSTAALYEYACHEGNYSLPGTLGGERQFERDRKSALKARRAKEAH